MHLASNSCPDIFFAVHQCARFTYVPCQSHAKPVKHILRYVKGTEDKGLILETSQNLQVYCYVDADFASLWGVEEYKTPFASNYALVSLLYFLIFPLTWVFKL